MSTRSETKRGLFELAFWFIALSVLRIALALLVVAFMPKFQNGAMGYILLTAAKGSLGMAIVITLLNRLLRRFLDRI